MRRQAAIRSMIAGIGATLIAASAVAEPPAFGFQQVDINDDGRIAAFEARRAGLAESRFERMDRDGDGLVSPLEWRAEIDSNGDGS